MRDPEIVGERLLEPRGIDVVVGVPFVGRCVGGVAHLPLGDTGTQRSIPSWQASIHQVSGRDRSRGSARSRSDITVGTSGQAMASSGSFQTIPRSAAGTWGR